MSANELLAAQLEYLQSEYERKGDSGSQRRFRVALQQAAPRLIALLRATEDVQDEPDFYWRDLVGIRAPSNEAKP